MFKGKTTTDPWRPSPRQLVLAVLGAVTVGVAVLSIGVSYHILVPRFGALAVPTVVALDALWVVVQATEVLAGNNRGRARRVQFAGLVLTAVIAAIPTVDLALTLTRTGDGFDLAVLLAPIAIVATKLGWWVVLPALGRQTSASTRETIATTRQSVADRLEEMEAEAAHQIELMRVATGLQERVTEAETRYRLAALASQQRLTEELHAQAVATTKTLAAKVLPSLVGQIALPALTGWQPTAPALPSTPGGTAVTQVNSPMGSRTDTSRGTPVTLADLAIVTGVPVPAPGEALDDAQLEVLLRHLRYSDDPPRSYRAARDMFRAAGFTASEERARRVWRVLMTKEAGPGVGLPAEDEAEEEADGVR
ncbi:hypothetical protein [Streptomyces sp. NPDC048340]|uniref:hypothetical protein n=1 Tax=Streptomyces sp. NPDC048340 TaxID=3365537 RepID=UPI003724BFD9